MCRLVLRDPAPHAADRLRVISAASSSRLIQAMTPVASAARPRVTPPEASQAMSCRAPSAMRTQMAQTGIRSSAGTAPAPATAQPLPECATRVRCCGRWPQARARDCGHDGDARHGYGSKSRRLYRKRRPARPRVRPRIDQRKALEHVRELLGVRPVQPRRGGLQPRHGRRRPTAPAQPVGARHDRARIRSMRAAAWAPAAAPSARP